MHIVAYELVCQSFAKAVKIGKMPKMVTTCQSSERFALKVIGTCLAICSSCKSFPTLRGLFNHVDARKGASSLFSSAILINVGNGDDPDYHDLDETDTDERMSRALCTTHQLFYTALRSSVTDEDIRQWTRSGVRAMARRQRNVHN